MIDPGGLIAALPFAQVDQSFFKERTGETCPERNPLFCFDWAADNFDRATHAEPGNAQAWHHLALACSHEKRWLDKAAEAIVRACQLAPMKPEYAKLAGRIHHELGMLAEAEQYYNRALTWGGDDPAVSAALDDLRKAAKRGRTGFFGKTEG